MKTIRELRKDLARLDEQVQENPHNTAINANYKTAETALREALAQSYVNKCFLRAYLSYGR